MSGYTKPWETGVLSVSENRRYLQNADSPFFWLGDTAWNLFANLDLDNTYIYLKNRADKSFNVIQGVLLGHRFLLPQGAKEEGLFSQRAMRDTAYWEHVDSVISMAEGLGLYMALLPTWGSMVRDGFLIMEDVEPYIDFLMKRYGDRPNVFWIVGGDTRGDTHFDIWDAMAKRLKNGTPDKLVGYHPFGRTSSSYWFQQCEWLDFHMFQSGHRRYDQRNLFSWDEEAAGEPWHGEDNWRYVQHDLSLTPLRPVLDGEPSYEQIPQGIHFAAEPRWQDYHVRRYAYWSVMAGACGHVFGHNSVFQFFGAVFSPPGCGVAETWDAAIHHPGASQMAILKKLMQEIDWHTCQPTDAVVGNGQREGHIATLGNDKNMLIYSYLGNLFSLRAQGYTNADAYWIDPASGVRSYFGKVDISNGKIFTPPVKPCGHNDWLLLLIQV